MAKNNGKPLRFGALIRVSTEKQEKKGESLRTQDKQITQAVQTLNGVIAARYGGQEHATAGWERGELDRLLADATKRKFDAVIVTDPSRWSRDHRNCDKHLDLLLEHDVRFFTLTQEHDLNSEDARLFLTLSSVINGYQARVTRKKSLDNRIERAKRGIPSAGTLPYGRRYDRKTGKWSVDPEAKAFMQELAERLLKGERMADLSKECGIGEVTLYLRLKKAGDMFPQKFKGETILIDVPPLLDAKTMQALRQQMERNRTFHRQQPKHQYLLSRLVFCDYCGSALSGQCQHGVRYYRHLPMSNPYSKGPCAFKGFVRADDLEKAVFDMLFKNFSNPKAIQRAIEKATPNRRKVEETRKRIAEIAAQLKKIKSQKKRIIAVDEKLTDDDAKEQWEDCLAKESRLKSKQESLAASIAHIPTKGEVVAVSYRILDFHSRRANPDDKRHLAETVFCGKTVDGKRMGVYVGNLVDGKREIRYILGSVEDAVVTSASPSRPR